jgi:tetratricopeptide (TPR) repeat protein
MSRRFVFAPLLLAILLPVRAAAAAEPWEAPAFTAAPAAIARAAAEIPTGEGGVTVLLSETRYAYDEAGRETYTQRLVYKIGSGAAHESWSAVEEAWSPWRQETPVLRARVITPDGAVHALNPAALTENSEPTTSADMLEDGRLLRAPLPAIRPGAVVEQEVVVREKVPFFEGGVAHYHILAAQVPVRRARLELELPADVPVRWVARRLPDVTPGEQVIGGSGGRGNRRRLVFEARDLPAYQGVEPGLPPEMARTPYVGFSTGRSWSDLAQRYSAIVDRTLAGADLQPFLRTVRVPAASQLETIGLVLARVHQEVRYTGLELGAGGLLPRSPAETLRRKFGDCKDKAVLLAGLLRALDIPAYVALLYATEDDQDVEEALPGFGVFNHAIVVVPGKPTIWIDPTDPYARIGELPAADQGRLALIAAPSTSGLVRTPASLPADNRETETREIYLADFGPARVVETSDHLGGQESELRALYSALPAEKVREKLAAYMEDEYEAEALTRLDIANPGDLSRPFRIRLEAEHALRGLTEEASAAVALFPASLLGRLPDELVPDEKDADLPPRRAEYVLIRPFLRELRYRIVPPAGFVPRELPASRERRLGPALLSETYAAATDGTVTATVRFDLGKRRLSAKEFDALRAAAGEIAKEGATLIGFEQSGEAHLAAGRVREALAAFERLAVAQPQKALPRTRVARALLAGGLGEAARLEAERAVRLEPDSALAHRVLAWILQHDALGRRFGPGHDRAGAIAAYRRARQLAPRDSAVRADLAILLEHDARGERYGAESDLATAIDEYRALREDLGSSDMDDNLALALLRAGRRQELRALLDEIAETEQRRILKLAAALDEPDAAVRLPEEPEEVQLAAFSETVTGDPAMLGVEALRRLGQGDLAAARQWLDRAHEEIAGPPSDDPLQDAPLTTLWRPGEEAGAEEIRCAAVTLALGYEATPALLRTLTACQQSAGSEARRRAFDLALAEAYLALDRPTDLVEVADRLAASAPPSRVGYGLRILSRMQLGRSDEARRIAEERLKTAPNDALALRTLAHLEGEAGHYDRQQEILQKLVETGEADEDDFHSLAWLALVRGRVDERAIENAQRAATLSGSKDSSILHTLAALYAELGRTAEAYQIILQALSAREEGRPEPDDWYVFGRLAEQYGLPEMARVYYERVKKEPGEADALSTYSLARRRLGVLGKAPQAKAAGR